jgi:chromosome segregation ATPase
LKYQYLEQNAKDRYVKSIVSDIDDAPIVTAEDVKELSAVNDEKKAKLKEAKSALVEMHNNIRTLTPLVQRDYDKTQSTIGKATTLVQKILDARLALTRLRQTHPQPRLTIAAADQKLADQVTEMQELSDQVEVIRKQVQTAKGELKAGTIKLENLRAERAETEKSAKNANVGEDDPRIAPLYDWYMLGFVESEWPLILWLRFLP